MERLASNGEPFFISTFKNILEKIKPAFRERNLLLG
jgi:hypothetical protein